MQSEQLTSLLAQAITEAQQGGVVKVQAHLIDAWHVSLSDRIQLLVESISSPNFPLLGDDNTKAATEEWIAAAGTADKQTLGTLMKTLGKSSAGDAIKRLEAIAECMDPRLPMRVLDLFESPPWRSKPALVFWKRSLEIISLIGHPYLAIRLQILSESFPAVVATGIGMTVKVYLVQALKSLPQHQSTELSEEQESMCSTIENLLFEHRNDAVKVRKRALDDYTEGKKFLEAIYEDPKNDAPRAVYADWLLERDNPRGVFITHQLSRTSGWSKSGGELELKLLEEHGSKWSGPIGPVLSNPIFHRGFPSWATHWYNKSAISKLVNDPSWATIETLGYPWDDFPKSVATKLVTAPNMRGLTGLTGQRGAPGWLLEAMTKRDTLMRLERLHCDLGDEKAIEFTREWLREAPIQHQLFVSEFTYQKHHEPKLIARLLESATQLKHLGIKLNCENSLPEWITLVETSPIEKLTFQDFIDNTGHVWIELSRGPSGRFDVITYIDHRSKSDPNERKTELLISWLLERLPPRLHQLSVGVQEVILPALNSQVFRTRPHRELLDRMKKAAQVSEVAVVEGTVHMVDTLW